MSGDRGPVDTSPSRLKVLDLGTMIAGPFVATLLGDLGAEVIKVEQPGVGDAIREGGMTTRWQLEARNKRSVTLNLRQPRGQEIARRLAGWADILVENFRPGTMDRWGLGYDDLKGEFPGLVYVSVSGYGQDGPYAGRAGYDFTGGAFGGLTAVTGYEDRPPVLPGLAVADYGTAAFATIGALEAIRRRDAPHGSGRGAHIDCALYESLMRIAGPDYFNYSLEGTVPGRHGGMPLKPGRSDAPHTYTYQTRDGRWISLYVVLDSHFQYLAKIIGDPALDDPRFATKEDRFENASDLDAIIRSWIAERDFPEIDEVMNQAGLPFSPVNTVADIVADPHVAARGNLVPVTAHDGRQALVQDAFPRIERGQAVRWLGEPLGASNEDVYGGLLGMNKAEIDDLSAAGLI